MGRAEGFLAAFLVQDEQSICHTAGGDPLPGGRREVFPMQGAVILAEVPVASIPRPTAEEGQVILTRGIGLVLKEETTDSENL